MVLNAECLTAHSVANRYLAEGLWVTEEFDERLRTSTHITDYLILIKQRRANEIWDFGLHCAAVNDLGQARMFEFPSWHLWIRCLSLP